jgi:hypothetical protein
LVIFTETAALLVAAHQAAGRNGGIFVRSQHSYSLLVCCNKAKIEELRLC